MNKIEDPFLEIKSEVPFTIPHTICQTGEYTAYRVETMDGSNLEAGSVLQILKDGTQIKLMPLHFGHNQFQLSISEFLNPKPIAIDTISKFELLYTAPTETQNIGIRVYHVDPRSL